MEQNQRAAQDQKEYYERSSAASEKLRQAKAHMGSEQPRYKEALALLNAGGDKLMVRQSVVCVLRNWDLANC